MDTYLILLLNMRKDGFWISVPLPTDDAGNGGG